MLEQDLETDQNQDDAARQLGLGLVARAEEIADLETDCGEQERRDADERDGQWNVDVGQQGKRDADGQRVDARGQTRTNMILTLNEALPSVSSLDRLSLIMPAPMAASRTKATQWSKAAIYCSNVEPRKYPMVGMSA